MRGSRGADEQRGAKMTGARINSLGRSLRAFFADHLPRLRGLSPHTIGSYRDSLTLLLRFMQSHRARPIERLDLPDIDAADIVAFLDHLEQERNNTESTRNVRLAALHSFFRFAALEDPQQFERSQRILSIPFKRARQRIVDYLEYDELRAVFDAVDRSTRSGRRDYALLVTMFNTGARVQEVLDTRAHDLQLIKPFQVRLHGKGRKERICPLWPQTADVLREFCTENDVDLRTAAPVFLNARGRPLTRFGVRYIMAKYADRARPTCPTLERKRLHPHTMRHSTAVHLLKSGVDMCTISHWLGHASVNTTNRYAVVDLEMKRQALARAVPPDDDSEPPEAWPEAWRSDATILAWLEAL
jgi:integrase/recombinase XerD